MLSENLKELEKIQETLTKLLPNIDDTLSKLNTRLNVEPQSPIKVFNDFKVEAEAALQTTRKSIIETNNNFRPILSPITNNSSLIAEKEVVSTESSVSSDPVWIEQHKQEGKVTVPLNRLEQIRKIVDTAVKNNKVFLMNGNYISIRKALHTRGWIEKPIDLKINFDQTDNETIYMNLPVRTQMESTTQYIKRCEKKIFAILLKRVVPDFIWNYQLNVKEITALARTTLINRFMYSRFSTKAGLCNILQNAHWFMQPLIADMNFPRCYNVRDFDQLQDFVENYRISASLSLLKTFLHLFQTEGISGVTAPEGTIQLSIMIYAIKICHYYMAERKNEDIDFPEFQFEEDQWRDFLRNCFAFVHQFQKFTINTEESLKSMEKAVISILKEMHHYWPQYEIDGRRNLWIIKPAARCRGVGIKIMNNFDGIMDMLNEPAKNNHYVCQKYIETPLLIHGHKFDIRQWFLVTSVHPLTIWIYKSCYIRFSSKKFNLQDYHEVIHLTNNAVQYKYKSLPKSSELPQDNMWDLSQFKEYLKSINNENYWDTFIYQKIKQIIIGTMLSSQEYIEARSNCYQMFGADLMIDNNLDVWLIEINSCPQMTGTSTVTSKLCPECFEDLIKVVVDRKTDMSADTGDFELIYRPFTSTIPERTQELTIVGRKMKLNTFDEQILQHLNYKTPQIKSVSNINDLKARNKLANESNNNVLQVEHFINQASISKHFTRIENVINDKIEEETFAENQEKMKEIDEHYDNVEKSTAKRIIPIHLGKAHIKIPEKQVLRKRKKKLRKQLLDNINILRAEEIVIEKNASVGDSESHHTLKGDSTPIKDKMYKNFPFKKVKTLYANKEIKKSSSKYKFDTTATSGPKHTKYSDNVSVSTVLNSVDEYLNILFKESNRYSENLKQDILFKCYSEKGYSAALVFLDECNKRTPVFRNYSANNKLGHRNERKMSMSSFVNSYKSQSR